MNEIKLYIYGVRDKGHVDKWKVRPPIKGIAQFLGLFFLIKFDDVLMPSHCICPSWGATEPNLKWWRAFHGRALRPRNKTILCLLKEL